eukprot:scaffold19583_cov28-Tisochrysis_lutea.AAC.3
MGWNSWNTFRCDISERLVLEVAHAMATNGLREAGYVYVNLDDCWMKGRDERGHILADAAKFPRGIKAVADQARTPRSPLPRLRCERAAPQACTHASPRARTARCRPPLHRYTR